MITYLLNKFGFECIRRKKNPSLKSHLFNLIDQYLIDIETLNRVLTPHTLKGRRILLKMDTQGYDLNVFKGASKYYANIACLLTEISLQQIYQKMSDYHETLSFYESKGFAVSGLYPVSRQKDSSVIEMDCFMINTQFKKNK